MSALNLRKVARFATVAIAVLLWPLARPVASQERQSPAAEFAAGALLFADDGVVREGFLGGAARFYVLPRSALGRNSRTFTAQSTSPHAAARDDGLSQSLNATAACDAVCRRGPAISNARFFSRGTFTSSEARQRRWRGQSSGGKRVTVGVEPESLGVARSSQRNDRVRWADRWPSSQGDSCGGSRYLRFHKTPCLASPVGVVDTKPIPQRRVLSHAHT